MEILPPPERFRSDFSDDFFDEPPVRYYEMITNVMEVQGSHITFQEMIDSVYYAYNLDQYVSCWRDYAYDILLQRREQLDMPRIGYTMMTNLNRSYHTHMMVRTVRTMVPFRDLMFRGDGRFALARYHFIFLITEFMALFLNFIIVLLQAIHHIMRQQ